MALREVLADLRVRVRGTEQLRAANAGIGNAVTSLRSAGRALGAVGAAISGALAIGRLTSWTQELIQAGDELDKTSQQIGLSVRELQRWRFQADRAGVNAQTMSRSIQRLQRSAFEASEGGRLQADSFRTLGIEIRDANGHLKGADQLMLEVTTALSRMEDSTAAVGLAQRIMGRTGAQLMPLFNQGAEGVEALNRRFDELGGGLGEDMVRNAAAAQDALTDWDLATQSIKGQLAVSFLPTLTSVINTMAEWAGKISTVLRRSNAFKVAMWALVAVMAALAIAVAPLVLGLLLLAAPFALLFLLVEDLVTLFTGGQSAIGMFIDELFGVGSAQAVVDTLISAWEWLVALLREGAELLGIVDAQPGDTPQAQRARRRAGKQETTPDGAEARAPARRQRERDERRREDRAAGNRRTQQMFGVVPVAGLRSSPTVPASAVGGRGGRGDTTQNVSISAPIRMEISGADDPQAVADRFGDQAEAQLRRAVARAAGRLPQGEARP